MTDHLPECPHSEPHLSPGFLVMCICDRLRACEARVRDAAWEAVADLTPFVFAYQTWISGDYGYDEGPWVKKENALAAIDALRGDAPHLDPCDCDDCRADVEHVAELHFQTLREDTP